MVASWIHCGNVIVDHINCVASSNKDTVYSAYVTDGDEELQYQQISTMRSDLGSGEGNMGYVIANTIAHGAPQSIYF